MQINASLIKEQRARRSWTQQHLADACEISLRTIQRVERLGVAAPETVLGLCAVLELQQIDLLTPQEYNRHKPSGGVRSSAIFAALIGALVGALVTYMFV